MEIKSKSFNRRNMMKYGLKTLSVTALGVTVMSGKIVFAGERSGKPLTIPKDKEQASLSELAEKYGGEFGGIRPEGWRVK
ncbi:hypothetical protein ACFL7D_09940 [candidate division KSB1 bacterium]